MNKTLDEMRDEVQASKKALVLLERQHQRKECTEDEFLRWREYSLGAIDALQWALGVQEDETSQPPAQRTEEAIREHLAKSEREMSTLRNQYRRQEVEKERFLRLRERRVGFMQALRWVLGERDRYD